MSDRIFRCGFCGKTQHEVREIIAGQTACICNECVAISQEIVTEQRILKIVRKELDARQEMEATKAPAKRKHWWSRA